MDRAALKEQFTEPRTLLGLPHPNIIRVRDSFLDKGEIGTCTDFVDGESLDKVMTSKQMTQEECLEVFTQVAVAFHLLHEKLVMHKNINAEHFVIKDRGAARKIVKTIGFSQLRAMRHVNSVTEGNAKMTLYAAPECLSNGKYTRAADIWGLGVLLLTMANGGKPMFETASSEDIEKAL
jgi:serine/threonine protein kinase